MTDHSERERLVWVSMEVIRPPHLSSGSETVSYTHLDVYKSQALRPSQLLRWGWRCLSSHSVWSILSIHWDVYKRQSCYWASRKQLKGAAAETLRPKAPKTSRHSAIEKSRFWKRLGFYSQWNIRDVLRNKLRSFITIFGCLLYTSYWGCCTGTGASRRCLWNRQEIFNAARAVWQNIV